MGISRSTEELEKLCRTDGVRGTLATNLYKASAAVEGCSPVKIEEAKSDVALLRLNFAITAGRATILLVSNWEHYVAAIGKIGDRFLVADSADAELVRSWSPPDLLNWWAARGARRPFWGLIL